MILLWNLLNKNILEVFGSHNTNQKTLKSALYPMANVGRWRSQGNGESP